MTNRWKTGLNRNNLQGRPCGPITVRS